MQKSIFARFKKQKSYQIIALTGMIYLVIFRMIPMIGTIIAFKKYRITSGVSGIFTSEWVGFKYFIEFFTDYQFTTVIVNSLVLIFLHILLAFPLPIIFAILINEVKSIHFKRVVQTISYMPHFISWVVIYGIFVAMFSTTDGFINELLVKSHLIKEPLQILTKADYFWGLSVGSQVWKEMGWSAIIFIAAIAGINPELYEAAEISGANRFAKIRYVTLPCIKSSIIVVLILTIGGLFRGSLFEQCLLLGNELNNSASEIIQTYSFKVGLVEGRFSYAIAIELFQSLIAITVIFFSNILSKKVTGEGLF